MTRRRHIQTPALSSLPNKTLENNDLLELYGL